ILIASAIAMQSACVNELDFSGVPISPTPSTSPTPTPNGTPIVITGQHDVLNRCFVIDHVNVPDQAVLRDVPAGAVLGTDLFFWQVTTHFASSGDQTSIPNVDQAN